jgi:hypothetical protein
VLLANTPQEEMVAKTQVVVEKKWYVGMVMVNERAHQAQMTFKSHPHAQKLARLLQKHNTIQAHVMWNVCGTWGGVNGAKRASREVEIVGCSARWPKKFINIKNQCTQLTRRHWARRT